LCKIFNYDQNEFIFIEIWNSSNNPDGIVPFLYPIPVQLEQLS